MNGTIRSLRLAAFCTSAALVAFGPINVANAQSVYVSDELQIALRTGPSDRHRILDFLVSGSTLKPLQQQDDWLEVVDIATKKQGWVKQSYTQSKPIAAKRLAALQAQLAAEREQSNTLQSELSMQAAAASSGATNLAQLEQRFEQVNADYNQLKTISTDALDHYNLNQKLREDVALAQSQSHELQTALSVMQKDRYNKGILHGLAAVITGVILALLIPKLRGRQNRNHW